jgi:type I restriction enzyme S subunit
MKPGYKQTEVGVIPEEWEVKPLGSLLSKGRLGGNYANQDAEAELPLMKMGNLARGFFDLSKVQFITPSVQPESVHRLIYGDVLFNTRNTLDLVGKVAIWRNELPVAYYNSNLMRLEFDSERICSSEYANYSLNTEAAVSRLRALATGTTSVAAIYTRDLIKLQVLVPPLPEQRAIAGALSDVDALLGAQEALLAKKRDLKAAAMQQLLTGETRLPGFTGEWEVKTLGETTDSLDNLRVPLNESQRDKMKGDYPYCGANGVLGFVDNYVVEDDIILMAEDGGYFDEYETRPIAYRMRGKCWVNNHAHILKAKPSFDQGFLFYSLVHKNILPFLASGTRAKLNKSEMNKIEVRMPKEQSEQTAIATVLSDMDAEIAALEAQRDKTRDLKQGKMQELLTGRIRLI